jgi:hypothetical protein
MNGREAKVFKELLESLGVSFKSKGTRVDPNPLYDNPQEPKQYISNDLTGRSTAYDREGNLVPLQQGLIPTEVFPTPSAMAVSTAQDVVSMANPLLGLVAGASMITPKWKGGTDDIINSYGHYKKKYDNYSPKKPHSYEQPSHTSIEGKISKPVITKKVDPKKQNAVQAYGIADRMAQRKGDTHNQYQASGNNRYKLPSGEQIRPYVMAWNPLTKQPTIIRTGELMQRLRKIEKPDGTKGAMLPEDYPYFQDFIGTQSASNAQLSQVPGFGGFRNVPSNNFDLQYATMYGNMHDFDMLTPSGTAGGHYSAKEQVSYPDAGSLISGIEAYHRNNPESVFALGQTGGGFRAFELGNDIDTSPMAIPNRVKSMSAIGDDNFYRRITAQNNAERVQEVYKSLGLKPQSQNDIIKNGITNPQVAKAFEQSKGLVSDVRLDEKVNRITGRSVPNYEAGPPMGYQHMAFIGDINKANANRYFAYRIHNDIMNRLRTAKGLTDPERPDMGLGALDSQYFDYMNKSLNPKWQEMLRQNWRLGLLPPLLTQDQESN